MDTRMQTQKGWVAEDLKNTSEWIHHLTATELQALDAALGSAKKADQTFETLTKQNFPLQALQPTFDRVLEELENGLGLPPSPAHRPAASDKSSGSTRWPAAER